MRKNLLILVVSVVLFSLFNTSDVNFSFWKPPIINTDYIISPDIPINYDTDIAVLGLVTNFFTKFELDYSVNNTDYTVVSDFIDDIADDTDIILSSDFVENVVEESIIEEAEDVVEASIVAEVIKDVVEVPIVEEVIKDVVEESIVEEVIKDVVEESIVEEVIKEKIEKPINPTLDANKAVNNHSTVEEKKKPMTLKVNKVVEESLPSDEEVIMQNPNIKENAKELILEALEEGDITIDDVDNLLKEYANKVIKKKHVNQLIKKKRK